jgi:hypothetical protein
MKSAVKWKKGGFPFNREDSCETGGLEPRPVEKAAVEYADEVPDGFYR